MSQESIARIEKDKIRLEFDAKAHKWYFSIVDVIAMTGQSSDSRNYWKVLKNRLKKEQNELVTFCNQLKMKAGDGKSYLTDVGDREVVEEILKLVSPKHIAPFRDWFDYLEQKHQDRPNISENPGPLSVDENTSYPQEEFMLLVDGYRENDFFIIQAFTAGVEIENIFISATCKTLTIKGERKEKTNFHEGNSKEIYSHSELSWGKFLRTIELPEEIEIDSIEAKENHGQIIIKLPILNKNRSKSVRIKSI
ncbi:MAG: Hsp20/alpha crystallin family protein [Candidatus Paceibacterota bacterium]|jgi:HSP20 family molecular chaperone IbpA